jgi:uncharacterized caspase-like protein
MTRQRSNPGIHLIRPSLLASSLVVLGLLGFCPLAAAQTYLEPDWTQREPDPVDPHLHAILIGCERYEKFPELRFCGNDCLQLAKTLTQRGGFDYGRVVQIVDTPNEPYRGPLRETVMRELPRMLSNLSADDQVIVFFSGHGYRDAEGHLYLATLDCDPQRPAETGVPVEWLREQLAACRAKLKLLLLDACHAGSEKGDAFKGVVAKDLGEPFRDVAGVMTLASSTADETSQLWESKEQSLFTYWVNQGLKGHADENGDSEIDLDELNKYVHRNVTRVAKEKFNRSQTPVRIMRGTPGSPVILKLNPLTLKELMSDIAEELSSALEDAGVKKVAVLEFTTETSLGEVLGANFGLLGKQCAADLERLLMQRAHNLYSVIDQRRLQTVLKQQRFSIADLGSDKAMEALSQQLDGLPAVAQGTLRSRMGRAITLQCKLLDTISGAVAASAGGVAMLNESEWAMLGHSAALTDNDFPPPSPDNPESGPQIDMVVHKLDRKSKQSHPLSDPRFEFPVRMMIGGRERKGVFRGNDYLVPVKKGEVYEIEVENRTDRPIIMRLLVDGLNTLPEKETDMKGVETYAVAKRVNLDEARFWVLDPKVSRKFSVRGFVTEVGPRGKLRRFTIVDGEESVAARQQFTEQLGLITVAFYEAQPLFRGGGEFLAGAAPGTGFGEVYQEDLSTAQKYEVGQLRAVVNLRYASPEAIQTASQQPQQQPEANPAPSPDSAT